MQRWFLMLVGLSTILWVVMYVLFRSGTVVYSFTIIGGPINQIIMMIFWAAEIFIMFNALGYFLNILTSLRRYKRPKIAYDPSRFVPVTILITAHNEPKALLERTLVACRYLDYPAFEVVLIDASDTPATVKTTKEVADEQGVTYFYVPTPRHGAKAGSLNEYLPFVKTKYMVMFDADYRPSRDFLKRLVPQMEADDMIGFIQTPQFYGNLLESPVSRAAQMQQSIFYEYICEGKSVHDAMFMCGTNLIIRTKALRDVKGFVEGSITEDFASSLNFIKKGWKTRYDNYTTAFGEGPKNLTEFFRQQYRWARGTLGVFAREWRTFIFPNPQLSFFQRLEFFLAGSYYFVGFVWAVLIALPILYIFFRIPVYFSDPVLYIFSYLPYFLLSLSLFMETLLSRRYKAMDWVMAQSLFLLSLPVYIQAAFDTLLHRKAVFEGTKKDVSVYDLPWQILSVQFGFFVVNTIAIVYGVLYMYVYGFEVALSVNLFWTMLHQFIFLLFLSYVVYKTKYHQRTSFT